MGQSAYVNGSARISFRDDCKIEKNRIFEFQPFVTLLGWKEQIEKYPNGISAQLEVNLVEDNIDLFIRGEFYNLFRYLPNFFKELNEKGLSANGHFLIECNDAANFAHYLVIKDGAVNIVENYDCELETIMNSISDKFWIMGEISIPIKTSRDNLENVVMFFNNTLQNQDILREFMDSTAVFNEDLLEDPTLKYDEAASDYTCHWIGEEWDIEKLWYFITTILPLLDETSLKIEDGDRYYFIEWKVASNSKNLTFRVLPVLNDQHEVELEPSFDNNKIISKDQWNQHLNELSEKEIIEKLSEYPWIITQIEKPTEKQYITAVRQYGPIIKLIKKPTSAIQKEAIRQHPLSCWMINEIDDEVKKEASKLWNWPLELIDHKDTAIDIQNVQQDWENIKKIINPTEPVQLAAVIERSFAIKYIEEPTERVKMESMKYLSI